MHSQPLSYKVKLFSLLLLSTGCNRFEEKEACSEQERYFNPEHILQVELTLDNTNWTALCNESRSFVTEFLGECRAQPFSGDYTYFSADVSIDGEALENIGLRKKGFIGSQSTEKPSLKLNLDEFVEGAELFCTDNITLNNAVQDPSLIRQCLGYELFAKAGIPSPQCNFARVSVNGADLGIYVHVEPVKRTFLRNHFGNDNGDLYEGTLSDFHPQKYRTFEPKNSDTDESLSSIIALTEALEDDSDLSAILEQHIDLDQFLTFWAMEVITGHWDGYTGNTNNLYIYRDPENSRFSFIPWGLDDVMDPELLEEEHAGFSSGVLADAILSDPELSERFHSKLNTLLDSVWNELELQDEIDRMEALLAAEIDISELEDAIEGIRQYVDQRRGNLQALSPFYRQESSQPSASKKLAL